MKDIVVSGTMLEKEITEALPKIFKDKFSSTYSNPIADIIQEEIKNNDGVIRTFVKKTIVDILTNPDFKDKVTSEVVALIINKGLSK